MKRNSKLCKLLLTIILIVPLTTHAMLSEKEKEERKAEQARHDTIRDELYAVIREKRKLDVSLLIAGGDIPIRALAKVICGPHHDRAYDAADLWILRELCALRKYPLHRLQLQEGADVVLQFLQQHKAGPMIYLERDGLSYVADVYRLVADSQNPCRT